MHILRTPLLAILLTTTLFLESWAAVAPAKRVENNKKSQGKTLKLTKDLVVTVEEDEDNYLWVGQGVSVVADSKGHMFVADVKENRIIELDKKGKFVRQIGRHGQGPGEFTKLQSFQILPNGEAVAFENLQATSSFTFYDQDMNYKDKITNSGFSAMLQTATLSPNRELIGSIYVSLDVETNEMKTFTGILSMDRSPKEILVSSVTPAFDPQRVSDPAYWSEFLASRFQVNAAGLIGFVLFDAQNHAYTAVANKYEITKWDENLKKQMVITRKYDAVPLPEQEIEALAEPATEAIRDAMPPQLQSIITKQVVQNGINLAKFPPVKNPVGALALMGDGTLLVLHNPSLVNDSVQVDMFSPEGTYIGHFNHSLYGMSHMSFKNGFAYAIEQDENDENYLVRYKYRMASAK